jgi:hypothetical protein
VSDFAHTVSNHIAQLAEVEPVEPVDSPFPILFVSQKNVAFHLIDLQTYQNFSAQQDCSAFFANLSTLYERQKKQLVHVWEDVWLLHPQLVEARVAVLLGKFTRYHARLTAVRKITNPVLVDFLRQHHLQVPIIGRYKYGLFFKEELLAVASFSAARSVVRSGVEYRSYELLRFANKTGCVVAGGLSKLLSHFISEQNPDDVMTYADRDWGNGKGYKQLGFELVGLTEPQEFALDSSTRQRRYLSEQNPSGISESDCLRVFNSGSYKYIKLLKSS